MLRHLTLSCAAITLFGVIAQGQLESGFCMSDADCPASNSACDTQAHSCECQGATSWKLASGVSPSYECEPFSYSYLDSTTNLWTCPYGLQGDPSWGSCCPPYSELVDGTCTCMNNLVEINGNCGCSAPFSIVDFECQCAAYTILQSNPERCVPYKYAISAGDGAYTCPKGAIGYVVGECACSGASSDQFSNNVLSCEPYTYATYNAYTNRYECAADQVAKPTKSGGECDYIDEGEYDYNK